MLNDIPAWLLRVIAWFTRRSTTLALFVNKIAINATVNVARHRPHPLSTAHDYVSWVSLTDKSWNARHLPPHTKQPTVKVEDVAQIFLRDSGAGKLSEHTTCLFPAFAQYLTDGFIRTRMPALDEPQSVRLKNTSNHDIDMCPLYGRTIEQTYSLREPESTRKGKGRLKSQIIRGEEFAPFLCEQGKIKSEFSALDKPLGFDEIAQRQPELVEYLFAFGGDRTNALPQVAMINTLFLREHNRLACEIEIAHPGWTDERIFQTVRNTIIVLFIKIVVEEYINHISPIIKFSADPSVAWNAPWNQPNWITTEFSLLYRWHSLMPDNIRWGSNEHPLFATLMNNRLLLDSGLASSLEQMSQQSAGVLCAFNTNQLLIPREQSALEQGRLTRLGSYSDYCAYVGLPRPSDFSAISKNQAVVDKLKELYADVGDVEFYVGLFAEDLDSDSPLPPLMRRMVALDAFSQALTNPLLSRNVFIPSTFSDVGWGAIARTTTLKDVALRTCPGIPSGTHISMGLR